MRLPPARGSSPRRAGHLLVRDDVHVDVARTADRPGANPRAGEQRRQPGAAARAQDELGGVLRAGEGEQGVRDVVPDHLVIGAAERLGQPALPGQCGWAGAGQAVGPGHVHGQQVTAGGPGGDPRGPPDQRVALGAAGERDDHPLPCLPGALDAVRGPVGLQALVDLVGQPQQGQLTQRGQVPGAEVVGQRRVDLLRRIDVAVRHPAPQRLRGHVDQLDLVGGAHHGIRERLPLRDAGDLLHHVVEGLEVLDVDGGDHVDAGVEQLLDVLPALLVTRSGHVGVRELVDQGDLRVTGQHGVEVHLLERGPPVGHQLPRDHLQAVDQHLGVRAPVRLGEGDHHFRAALGPPVALAQHGEGLADPRGSAQVDPEEAPLRPLGLLISRPGGIRLRTALGDIGPPIRPVGEIR